MDRTTMQWAHRPHRGSGAGMVDFGGWHPFQGKAGGGRVFLVTAAGTLLHGHGQQRSLVKELEKCPT